MRSKRNSDGLSALMGLAWGVLGSALILNTMKGFLALTDVSFMDMLGSGSGLFLGVMFIHDAFQEIKR
jgi:hypothetical protein